MPTLLCFCHLMEQMDGCTLHNLVRPQKQQQLQTDDEDLLTVDGYQQVSAACHQSTISSAWCRFAAYQASALQRM